MPQSIVAKSCVAGWLVCAAVAGQAAAGELLKVPCTDDACDSDADAKDAKGWSLDGGATALVGPARNGGRRYLFSPVPFAELSYGDVFEASTREGVSLALFSEPALKAGALFDLDRRERASQGAAGRPLAAQFGTGGLGGFAEWALPSDSKARLEVSEGILGRRGVKTELTAARTYSFQSGFELDLGGKVRGGDRNYVDSVYRLPKTGSSRLAVPGAQRRHGADGGGATTVGPTAEARYSLGKSDTVTASLAADRLVGAAARLQATRGNVGRHTTGTFELGWQHKLTSVD